MDNISNATPNNKTFDADRGGTFTYDEYRALLRALRARGYGLCAFPEAESLLTQSAPFALLRHDIDMGLEKALAIAELEAAEGAASTYFIMLRSDHYNPFSAAEADRIRRLAALGHGLGLHFDAAVYPELADSADAGRFRACCRREIDLFEQWFERPIQAVSFHRPSPLILAGSPELTAPAPHTYMPLFTKAMHYVSDSTGRWRFGPPLASEAFAQGRPLHILTHPIWWNAQTLSPQAAVQNFIDDRRRMLEHSVAANCTSYRAPNDNQGSS